MCHIYPVFKNFSNFSIKTFREIYKIDIGATISLLGCHSAIFLVFNIPTDNLTRVLIII